MQILTVATHKGGAGKTTTAAALAQAAVKAGKKVLAIDLDGQANFSYCLAADTGQPGSYDLLHGTPAAECIQHTEQGLDVMAAVQDLDSETTRSGSGFRLKKALEPIKGDYDFIIIDTAPAISDMLFNALVTSTGLIIPLQTDIGSMNGFYQIVDVAQQMQKSNPALTITGVVVTQYNGQAVLYRQVKENIAQTAAEMNIPYLMEIRKGVAIAEAQALQRSLYDYAPKSKPAIDYEALYQMIAEQPRGATP